MQTKQKKKILLVIGIVVVVILAVPSTEKLMVKSLYATKYDDLVNKYSEKYDVDPLLVFAIIKAESNFDADVVSQSGAIGLMQLMDNTAKETAPKAQVEYNSKEDLLDPEININLGTKYFSILHEKYGNITIALTAYNAGTGNVDKWLETGVLQKDGTNAEEIPFKETNNYVRKILRDYEIYKKNIDILQ